MLPVSQQAPKSRRASTSLPGACLRAHSGRQRHRELWSTGMDSPVAANRRAGPLAESGGTVETPAGLGGGRGLAGGEVGVAEAAVGRDLHPNPLPLPVRPELGAVPGPRPPSFDPHRVRLSVGSDALFPDLHRRSATQPRACQRTPAITSAQGHADISQQVSSGGDKLGSSPGNVC
eukprot:3940840-Rhodomonas_salina.2